MSYYKEAIIKHIVTNVATEGKEAYQKFFNSALAKFGIKSPSELSDEKKKEFFNYIDDNYKAKNESTKEYGKTLDKMARDKKLKMLSKKDKVLLVKIADLMKTANEGKLSSKIKKAILIAIQMSGNMTGAVKKIEKMAKGLSDDDQVAAALRLANESIFTEANLKDSDVILSKALGEFLETEMDIRKALVKDKRVAKHIGKWDKADLEVYFDDDELVAGGDSGATIVRVKGDMTLGDLKKAILKKNPKLWKEAIKESTPLQVKMGAYTDVLHALEKYSKILNKAKETKKAKLAMKMMKNLQKSFFANEQWIGELKHPRSTELLDDIKQKVAKLLRIASGEHSDKVFDKLKSSKKALKAAEKLLGKIS